MKKINPTLLIGLLLLTTLALLCIFSYIYMPYPPNLMNHSQAYLPAGRAPGHLLGTDQYGRDILSRIMYGSRTVLLISLVSVLSGSVLGSLLGFMAASLRGIAESVIMRAMDGLLAFPGTLMALMLVAAVGKGQSGAIMAISIYTVAPFSRLCHSLMLENESLPMIKAAKSFSVSKIRLVTHYYLPLIMPKLITQLSASIASAIMTEAALSFLGLGVQPPYASWGLMLSEAKDYALFYPYLAVSPATCIFLSVLGFQLFSDGLNEYMAEGENVNNEKEQL